MIRVAGILSIFILFLSLVSCDKFIRDEEIGILKQYEEKEYRLKKDVSRDDDELKKGSRVKLLVRPGDESIKVYCYSAEKKFLKAERILILYVFREDFKDEIFDIAVFEEKLYETVEPLKK